MCQPFSHSVSVCEKGEEKCVPVITVGPQHLHAQF